MLHVCKKRNLVLGNAKPVLSVKPKRGWYVVWLFFQIGLCSAISLKRSRRELSIHVAEYRSTLENYRNTHQPCFSFIPKTGIASSNKGILVLLWCSFGLFWRVWVCEGMAEILSTHFKLVKQRVKNLACPQQTNFSLHFRFQSKFLLPHKARTANFIG